MITTIKSKLFAGFSVLLLFLFSMAVVMMGEFSASNERMVDLVDVSSRKISLSHEIMEDALQITRFEKLLFLDRDSGQRGHYQSRIWDAFENIEEKTTKLNGLVDQEGKKMLDAFLSYWLDYQSKVQEVIQLADAEEHEKAFQLSLMGDRSRVTANNQLEALIEKNEIDIQRDKLENQQSYAAAQKYIIFLVGSGILAALLVSFWMIRSINRRIAQIVVKAEKIASRENSEDLLLKEDTPDELNPVLLSLASIKESFREVTENANKVASGDYTLVIEPRSHRDTLGNALKEMTHSLQTSTEANKRHTWLTSGLNQLNGKIIGNQGLNELSGNIISFLVDYLKASIGAVYLMNGTEEKLELKGSYAFAIQGEKHKKHFILGEGLVGQAAKEKKCLFLTDVVEEHLRINSAMVDAPPKHLIIIPFLFEDKVLGVLEIGKFKSFSELEQEFLQAAIESIVLSIHSAIARAKVQELLEETQIQSEELQTQQEELKQMNEELEEQTQNLKQQQEELQMTNEELEEQTQSLEAKNKEVEAAKRDIEKKTKQLEITSKYKSEFLANMSHELRTPLNSLLILSKDLAENKMKNLHEDQMESAEIIYKSGQDLLILINEVLDLSRVEAGKMTIHVEKVHLREMVNNLLNGFKRQASEKELKLEAQLSPDLPEFIRTDPQRLNQVLRNLMSNAIKFTEQGGVDFSLDRINEDNLVISVKDTGIGIKEEKQLAIFEAFQQADGGTARKYGGTGLGLSISRELARLLGGEIKLWSKENQGSVFSLEIPINLAVQESASQTPVADARLKENPGRTKELMGYPTIPDDRHTIQEEDKVVLIIEDDLKFAAILLKQANQKGFKALSASTGEAGLGLAQQYLPQAIMLDLDLPGINGRQVLAQIKSNPALRHIPVHIISVNERSLDPIREGAVEYLMKPIDKKELDEAFTRIENFISRKMKNLLIVEDDKNSRTAVRKLVGNGDVNCLEAGSGEEALKLFREHRIDCIILDIGLPDMSGFDLIYKFEKLKENIPPIIIYTGKELSKQENQELQKYAESVIIKGVKSEERLLDETALFLHLTIKSLPESKQRMITHLYDKAAIFQNRKILVVDDDMRNVFALSKVLKEKGMNVVKADHGKSALEILHKNPEMDLVLMDIMMPEMDGYEAMRKIRSQVQFKKLPIIALTAKAMRDDKKKCIDAGANDYIAKPVDVDRLLSLMQVWLSN